jgi:DNA-directed RNA polymerase subunit K
MAEEEKFRFTKYEKARMLGSRALQIAMGAPFLIKLEEKDLKKIKYSPLEIAKLEFEEGVIPLTVRRPLPKRMAEEPEKK